MAKARAIVKRRKAVRNIRKITKTMQMIATAKFQKSLKRAVGTKPFTLKVRELVKELAASVGNVEHPLLRRPEGTECTDRIALVVITSNRGLAGAYNGNVLRKAIAFIHQQEEAGKTVDLYVCGKKGVAYFNFQKRAILSRQDFSDMPQYAEVERSAQKFMDAFNEKKIDALHVAYMNFVSTSTQKAEILTVLPLAGVANTAGQAAQANKGAAETGLHAEVTYDFSPAAKELLDYLLPMTVKTALFQCFLDATTSEHVMRMVAMTSATDNADKMLKSLTMQYNRARQSQITTELSEIMGGVEAMKG
ncbi:MAG: ATP synthase F1 subunit gamma [Tepidisphaeraceae bacterium]|jgi:F-type H+-transporting ATPase subunit gamma